mgnify:CR=1 FL=1
MNIQPTSSLTNYLPAQTQSAAAKADAPQTLDAPKTKLETVDETKLRDTFNQFVGETFFSQLIKSMRSSLGKPAYFHGGRAEEVFQGQLDQMLSEQFAKDSADQIASPMYELFQLNRQR